jgi:phage baseplate assembly protein W
MDGRNGLVRDERLDFIGRGWAFPIGLDLRGRVELTTGTGAIERAIRLILQTVRGARVMRPQFGSDLHLLAFAENNATTAGLADFYVRRALARWEPRIEVENVKATWPDADQGTMTIDITYIVKATNDRRNLVFPFYAIPQEE